MTVTKHDGRKEPFKKEKIENAVTKAAKSAEVGKEIANEISFDRDVTVDEIHDAVEKKLMEKYPDVAKAYILYRQKRTDYRLGKTDMVKGIDSLLLEASKDNANSENSMASKAHFVAEHVLKETELLKMNPKYAENHRKGICYIHDLPYRHMSVNCFFSPLYKMLKEGFDNGTGYVRPPKHITTAGALASIILQSMQSNFYGGEGYVHWDTDLAPYAEGEYKRQVEQIKEVYGDGYVNYEKVYELAMKRTRDAVFQAMQAFVYNANTQKARSGGQNVFSSINFGTDTSFWGRMISEMTLKAFMEGMGNGEMPFFPVLCFRLKKGINLYEGDPNFDLTMLALDCVGIRIMPRFVLADSDMYENKKDCARMGCLEGKELVTYKYQGETYTEGIKRLFDRVYSSDCEGYLNGKAVCLKPEGLEIQDGNRFVSVKSVIKNESDTCWARVSFTNGRSIEATTDHPFYTNRGRVTLLELQDGDEVEAYWSQQGAKDVKTVGEDMAYILGLIIADGNYANGVTASFGVDEQDIIKKMRCSLGALGIESTMINYRRGEKGNYDVVRIKANDKINGSTLSTIFGGDKKEDRAVPCEIFNATKPERLSFLAGVVDADGHVSHKAKVQIGSTNKELALGELALAQSVGCPAKLYINHYNEKNGKVRYRVEFSMTNELADYMASMKKKTLQWDGKYSWTKAPKTVKVKSIELLPFKISDSYDVETETDHFNASFIKVGNCRTNIGTNINGDNSPEARGNLAFDTVNLPYLALLAKEKNPADPLSEFWDILAEAVGDAIGELHERYGIMCSFKAKDFPFASKWYMGHENLKDENDSMEKCFRNGSLSVGYIGLAECLITLTGKHHGESEESQELGLKIIKYMKNKTDEATQKYHVAYAVFSTPAENACFTLMNKTKKRFGIVKGVTDHDFFTNSCHIPVWAGVDAKKKIDIEGKYHLLALGGSIFYLEVGQSPKWNKEGLLDILQYAAEKKEIGYMGFNFAMNFCHKCHYKWDGDEMKCPWCGSSDLQRVAIVTGYLADVNRWNDGKLSELDSRKRNL